MYSNQKFPAIFNSLSGVMSLAPSENWKSSAACLLIFIILVTYLFTCIIHFGNWHTQARFKLVYFFLSFHANFYYFSCPLLFELFIAFVYEFAPSFGIAGSLRELSCTEVSWVHFFQMSLCSVTSHVFLTCREITK